jgi:peroxiredoxin
MTWRKVTIGAEQNISAEPLEASKATTCIARRTRMLVLITFILSAIIIVGSVAAQKAVHATLEPVAERQNAPAFALRDKSGKAVDLSKYNGRVVLLNFWATDCGGCRTEVPWFVEFQKKYKRRGLTVVGVSMDILYEDLKGPDEAWQRVNPFVASHKVAYPILMGDDAVTKAYDINSLPATYLIDRSGKVATKYIGLVDRDNLQSNLETLLHE